MDGIKPLTHLGNQVDLRRTAQNTTAIRFGGVAKGWKQRILLRSDAHHDSPACDRAFEKMHLDAALKADALILDFGDAHDAMQGKGDPRGNLDDLLPQYKTGKYLDSLCDVMIEDYKPYATHWALMAQGNHETAVLSRKEVDLTERVVAGLRREEGCEVQKGGYAGWVLLQFTIHTTVRTSMRLYYSHGYGGENGNAFGVGQVRAQSSYLNDVDILVSGHSHNAYHVPMLSIGVSDQGKPYDKVMHALRIPGYKSANRKSASGGFEVEKGHKPKPIGAIWLDLEYFSREVVCKVQVDVR